MKVELSEDFFVFHPGIDPLGITNAASNARLNDLLAWLHKAFLGLLSFPRVMVTGSTARAGPEFRNKSLARMLLMIPDCFTHVVTKTKSKIMQGNRWLGASP